MCEHFQFTSEVIKEGIVVSSVGASPSGASPRIYNINAKYSYLIL